MHSSFFYVVLTSFQPPRSTICVFQLLLASLIHCSFQVANSCRHSVHALSPLSFLFLLHFYAALASFLIYYQYFTTTTSQCDDPQILLGGHLLQFFCVCPFHLSLLLFLCLFATSTIQSNSLKLFLSVLSHDEHILPCSWLPPPRVLDLSFLRCSLCLFYTFAPL